MALVITVLASYLRNDGICAEAMEKRRSIHQKSDVNEDTNKIRFIDGLHLCGNVHGEDEKIHFCIDGPVQKKTLSIFSSVTSTKMETSAHI